MDDNVYYPASKRVWKTVVSRGKFSGRSGNFEIDISCQTDGKEHIHNFKLKMLFICMINLCIIIRF